MKTPLVIMRRNIPRSTPAVKNEGSQFFRGLGPGSTRSLGGTGLFPALISVQAADRGAMGDHRPRIQADGLSLSSLPSVTATLLWRTGSMDSTSSRLDALWRVLAVLQLARARGLHPMKSGSPCARRLGELG